MLRWLEKNIAVNELQPYERNPRRISKEAFERLKRDIAKNGYHQRIIATQDLRIIGGHQRIKALQELGITEIPVLVPSEEINDQQFREMLVKDNLSFGEFDYDILSADYELQELIDYGLSEKELLGFFSEEHEGLTDPDEVPELNEDPITQVGDIWLLGNHRLMCGDSTKADDVAALLGDVKQHLMVTDVPYGVEYTPEWRDNAGGKFGDGKIKMRGKVQNDDRADWSEAFALFPGNIVYVWHASLKIEVIQSLIKLDFNPRSQIIWVKPHFIMSRGDYHWKHETCLYAVKGTGNWKGDRKQTTVWEIAGMNPAGGSKKSEDKHTNHSTQKPVECMKRPIENNSSPGQAVYDPFSGSGTTIIAGEMTGRSVFAMEISPAYVAMAIIRFQNFTGRSATHVVTGQTFNELAEARKAA